MRYLKDGTTWPRRLNVQPLRVSLHMRLDQHSVRRSVKSPLLYTAVMVLVVCTACQGDRPQPQGVVRDSAGVRIVEHGSLPPAGAPSWSLSMDPSTIIGAQDQPPEHALFRVVGAHRFPDGRLVIANAGTSELMFFDSRGQFSHTAGGPGEGPGEFGRLRWIQIRRGDTIVAFDGGPVRLVEFDLFGTYVRTVRLEATTEVRLPVPIIIFPDGGTLAEGAVRIRSEATDGIERSVAAVTGYGSNGEYLAPLGVYPAIDFWIGVRPGGRPGRATPFFGKTTRFLGNGPRYVVADNAIAGFDVHDQTGKLSLRTRWQSADRTVTPADVDRARAVLLDGIDDPNQRREQEAWYARVPAAETRPAFAEMRVADTEGYWVRRYAPPGTPPSERWMVFSADGEYIGDASVPAELTLIQIGLDFVVVQTQDADDVEIIQVHVLERTTGS